jgi:chromosome segregation ATPase
LEPPWQTNYTGGPSASAGAEEPSATQEKLTILATALQESNTTMTQNVRDIVNEHSTPIPTTKGLKAAVDKMDKARKKLREAEKARYNMHSSWRRYIADSLQRWTQFAEKFGKDDQELAERVKAAKERLQKTKEEVEAKKAALEELDEEDHVDISDEEMNEKVDSAENIQVSLTHMVESLNNMKQQADAAIVEAGENKPKRQRTEEHGCGGSASETLGSKSKAMEPFGKPGK